MKSKFSVVPFSVALLAAATSCLASGDAASNKGVAVSAASVQRKMPVKAKLNAVPAEYAARMNTSSLMEGEQYDNFIVHYRTYSGLSNIADNTSATHNARVAGARNVSIQEKGKTGTGGRVIKTAKAMSPSDAQAFMLEYAKSAEVESIEPNAIMQLDWDFNWYMNFRQTGRLPDMVTPNDPYFSDDPLFHWGQWGLSNERGVPGIVMPSAWGYATGRGVVVAVVDTGITMHSDLAGQVLPGYNFVSDPEIDRNRNGRSADASDPGDWFYDGDTCPRGRTYPSHDSTWHGTHVAGIIAAKANNGIGVAGVAYNSKILPVRAMARCGGYSTDIADGIIWASGGSVPGVPANPNPAKVINLSLGGWGTCSNEYQQAINIARSNGAIVVVSAGNDMQDASLKQPANCQGVIVVGATTNEGVGRSRTGEIVWFSNYGPLITVMAPGDWIYSTVNAGETVPTGESYKHMSGTSQAAPHVAGVVALVLERNPGLTTEQVKKYIVPTAVPMKGAVCPDGCGAGLIDAWGSVFPMVISGGATTIQPGQSVAHLSSNWGDGDAERWFDITLPAGTRAFKLTTEGGTGTTLIAATKNPYYMWWRSSADNDCEWQKFCQTTFDAPLTEPVTYYINVGTRSTYSNVTLVTHIE